MSKSWEALHYSQIYYKQWRNNELPYKILLSWTESELQTLKNRLSELDGRLNKGRLSFSERWLPEEKKATEYAINYLQAILDEVKESVPDAVSPPPQAPETNEKGHSYEKSLFNLFSEFKKHSEYLKNKGFYSVGSDNLEWHHGGNVLLAAYFGLIQEAHGNKRCIWADIEKAFNTKNLSQFYSDYEKFNKCKSSKYAKYDKELQSLVNGTIRLD